MAPHGKELTREQKEIIVQLSNTQGKLSCMKSEFHANSTHEKETENKHTNIARRKHTIFMQILHDFMLFLCDYHVKLFLHDFRA